jgi:hypothetical protein
MTCGMTILERSHRPRTGEGRPACRCRRLRDEAGFSLIEMVFAALLLAILVDPIAQVLVSSARAKQMSKSRTSADQIVAAKLEAVRALPYEQIGLVNGNPSGVLTSPDASVSTIPGATVSLTYAVTYVNDPASSVVTYADYKKIVVTLTRTKDGKILSQKTTYVSAAAAAPDNGQDYVGVKRTIVDMNATHTPLAGATVSLATGPSAPRTDISDSTGTVLFPALTATTSGSVYDTTASLSGYNTFPLDFPTYTPGHLTLHPGDGIDGPKQIRMYKTGISLIVNLVNQGSGTPFTSSSTVFIGSPSCGAVVTSVTSGTTTVSNCTLGNSYTGTTTIPMPPQAFTVAAQSGTKFSAPVNVDLSTTYPANVTTPQVVTVTMPTSGASATTATVNFTVKKGGTNVQNAHVELKNTNPNVYLFGLTNSSGKVTFTTVPNAPSTQKYTLVVTDALGATFTNTYTINGTDPNATVTIS